MRINQLAAKIGETVKNKVHEDVELSSIIQDFKLSAKDEKKNKLTVFLDFDIPKKEIRFSSARSFVNEDVVTFNYFGNNSASSRQYYLTRRGESIHYLLSKTFRDLHSLLNSNTDLAKIIKELEKQEMINKEGVINFSLIPGIQEGKTYKTGQKNVIEVDGQEKTPEGFIQYVTDASNMDKFVLVVPRVIKRDGEAPIVLSKHPDYINNVKEHALNLQENDEAERSSQYCHVCNKLKAGASSLLTKKFSRSGVNKVFETTNYHFAKEINKKNYDHNYALCQDCYTSLLFGEKKINKDFTGRLAGEKAFIIPESLLGDLGYEGLELKKSVDLCFEPSDLGELSTQVDFIMEKTELKDKAHFVVHFIVYRSDGNSLEIIDSIEDVPMLNIIHSAKEIGKASGDFIPYIKSPLRLSDLYNMVPIRKDNKGRQLNAQRLLDIYKALLQKHTISKNNLINIATESLSIGFNELNKSRVAQYHNLDFAGYNFDFFAMKQVMRYLSLMEALKNIGILVDTDPGKEGRIMTPDMENLKSNNATIQEMENFLDLKEFSSPQRSLFYLGAMLERAASAQWMKGHKSKPVLKKVQYQGMKDKEVIWLYQDLLEKYRQYDLYRYAKPQLFLSAFHYYASEDKGLTEQENVFYLMAGYAYMIGKSIASSKDSEEEADENNE